MTPGHNMEGCEADGELLERPAKEQEKKVLCDEGAESETFEEPSLADFGNHMSREEFEAKINWAQSKENIIAAIKSAALKVNGEGKAVPVADGDYRGSYFRNDVDRSVSVTRTIELISSNAPIDEVNDDDVQFKLRQLARNKGEEFLSELG